MSLLGKIKEIFNKDYEFQNSEISNYVEIIKIKKNKTETTCMEYSGHTVEIKQDGKEFSFFLEKPVTKYSLTELAEEFVWMIDKEEILIQLRTIFRLWKRERRPVKLAKGKY